VDLRGRERRRSTARRASRDDPRRSPRRTRGTFSHVEAPGRIGRSSPRAQLADIWGVSNAPGQRTGRSAALAVLKLLGRDAGRPGARPADSRDAPWAGRRRRSSRVRTVRAGGPGGRRITHIAEGVRGHGQAAATPSGAGWRFTGTTPRWPYAHRHQPPGMRRHARWARRCASAPDFHVTPMGDQPLSPRERGVGRGRRSPRRSMTYGRGRGGGGAR
jgi:hypothetical protein